jgi:autotransporter-associated beta strand protein
MFQLRKSGAGTLRLEGTGTWTGGTEIRHGELQVANGGALPDNGLVTFPDVAGAADEALPRRLDLADDEIIGGLTSAATLTNVTVDLNSSMLFVNGAGDFARGTITGGAGGRFVKTGSGVQTIRTSNTYTGGTTVSGGTLALAATTGTPLGSGSVLIEGPGRLTGGGNLPGTVAVQTGGTLSGNFNLGSLSLATAGRVELEWLTDTLTVTGAANLTGGALSVFAGTALNPALGTTWNFLSAAGGVNGTFASSSFPSLPSGKSWRVVYGNTLVSLQVVPGGLLGDCNEDGTVNAADYTVWRNRRSGIGGTTLPNDAGAPGTTIEDYNYWKAHYGETIGSGSTAAELFGDAVPESGTLSVATLASVILTVSARLRHRIL